jgi:hypothetical protein
LDDVRENLCPACGAPLQLVWVHGHGQCMNCSTPVVGCCTGSGQEADERAGEHRAVGVDEVLQAFDRCRGGAAAVTLGSLVLTVTQQFECTQDDATAAIERAVAVRRLALADGVVRAQA